MIKTLLVDDETLARRELSDLLSREPDISIIGEANNGIEAVEAIIRLKPDLLFLDIEMPGLNGFEVINSLNNIPTVVFVTAYDQYAIRAFEVNAIDYLLKPVTAARLQQTLERARRNQQGDSPLQSESLRQFLSALQLNQLSYIARLAVQKGKRVILVRLRDIIYIKVEDKLVFVYTETGRFLINKTISQLEQSLSHQGFFRINRSTILNLDFLDEIIPWFSATCMLKLSNGLELPLSRERVAYLKEAVGLLRKSTAD
jgi:two-component system LytT family response regulator/two-component system response regulator LytT